MKLPRDPSLHFLLLGAVVFVAYGLLGKSTAEESDRIVISRRQIENLSAGFTRIHDRNPSPDEQEGLIRDYLREEIYYREAVALGLDRDDAVIRQRLRQKMEFVSDHLGAMAEPSEDELRAFFTAHRESFRVGPTITFTHVYLDPARRRDTLAHDAGTLLAHLTHDDATDLRDGIGDPFVLATRFAAQSIAEIAALFGDRFAAELRGSPTGQWQGPIESAYGVHLVFVNDRTQGHVPALEQVRDAVRDQWTNRQRQQANDQLYASLLQSYAITIEKP